jgi:heme/copper-type cytochrome/quinol oxidase subunit 2
VPIPLLVAFPPIAILIVVIIGAIVLNVRYQRNQAREYFGKKSANRLTTYTVIACTIVLILVAYLLLIFGIE